MFDYSKACSEVAHMTHGVSGRELTNLALDWQNTTYASHDGIFTRDIMLTRTDAVVKFKKDKVCNVIFFFQFI